MVSNILRKLISNAIKFKGEVGHKTILKNSYSHEIILSVADNVAGIKNEKISKLFRVDQQVSAIGIQNEEGTSLGLILCKKFSDKPGGKIRVESGEGKGSVFYFPLPLLLY